MAGRSASTFSVGAGISVGWRKVTAEDEGDAGSTAVEGARRLSQRLAVARWAGGGECERNKS